MALMKLSVQDQHQLAVETSDGRGWFCLVGVPSGELLTWLGELIVHHDRDELAMLTDGPTVIPVPSSAASGPFLPISSHPSFAAVTSWDPINPKEFRP